MKEIKECPYKDEKGYCRNVISNRTNKPCIVCKNYLFYKNGTIKKFGKKIVNNEE